MRRSSRAENDVFGAKTTQVLDLSPATFHEDMITKSQAEVYILPFEHIRRSRPVRYAAFYLLTTCELPTEEQQLPLGLIQRESL